MTAKRGETPSALSRPRARSRAALIRAAQSILAERGPGDVRIQEITDAADLGLGTFYNHFETRADLFEAAVAELMEELGLQLEQITADLTDPAEVFAVRLRICADLARARPEIARIFVRIGFSQLARPDGLAPRALADLQACVDAGRLTVTDPHVALTRVAGCLFAHLQMALDQPGLLAEDAAETLAADMLVLFGMPRPEAESVARRPLPVGA